MAKDTSGSFLKILLKIGVTAVVLFMIYLWLVLSWSYSSGERAGYVQKLSKKGWICKTWEGELALISMPGTVAEKFFFTVQDDKIAAAINNSMGQRVSLTYNQHIGIPTTCFGETQYFISAVKVVEQPAIPVAPQIPPAPPAATPAPAN
jgi:hypothetical protein